MATFVLVHGAFQGGWIWKDVAEALGSMGHEVHTPTLTGCGYLNHGARQGVDLHAFVQDVTDYLAFEEIEDAVLVAQSYSGMVCGAVMMRAANLLSRAVYVDAMIPEAGKSFADIAGEAFLHMLAAHKANGWKINPWPLKVFGVPENKADWFKARLRPFPEAAFLTPFPGEFDPTVVDVSFITCRATTSPFIRAMADKARALGWPVSGLDSGHSPMTTHPEALAAMLAQTAEAAPAAKAVAS